jgi:4-hydroxybenzoate polyprenyltransferase
MTSWPVALTSFAYIVGVTALSRGEVTGGRAANGVAALVLLGASLTGLVVLAVNSETGRLAALALTLGLGWRVVPPFWEAYRQPGPVPIRKAVKTGVVSLVLLDAAIAAAYAGTLYSLGVVAVALVAGWLARSFAVT